MGHSGRGPCFCAWDILCDMNWRVEECCSKVLSGYFPPWWVISFIRRILSPTSSTVTSEPDSFKPLRPGNLCETRCGELIEARLVFSKHANIKAKRSGGIDHVCLLLRCWRERPQWAVSRNKSIWKCVFWPGSACFDVLTSRNHGVLVLKKTTCSNVGGSHPDSLQRTFLSGLLAAVIFVQWGSYSFSIRPNLRLDVAWCMALISLLVHHFNRAPMIRVFLFKTVPSESLCANAILFCHCVTWEMFAQGSTSEWEMLQLYFSQLLVTPATSLLQISFPF